MRKYSIILFLFSFSLAHGCTYSNVSKHSKSVSPVTYTVHKDTKIERSVGKLRRLVVLPVQLKVSPKDPNSCLEQRCGWEGLDNIIREEAISCLQKKRGYEVISNDFLGSVDNAPYTPNELSEFAILLAENARESKSGNSSGEKVVTLIKDLGSRTGVDGIVVIQGKATFSHFLDWVALYATFTLSAPISMLRVGVTLRADVFEVSSGQRVWTSTLTTGAFSIDRKYGMMLFESIEPAIPKVLTLPLESNEDDGGTYQPGKNNEMY